MGNTDLLRARALSNELWQRLLGGTESRNQNLGLLVGILPVPEDDHILKEQIGPRLLTWGHGWECPAYNHVRIMRNDPSPRNGHHIHLNA